MSPRSSWSFVTVLKSKWSFNRAVVDWFSLQSAIFSDVFIDSVNIHIEHAYYDKVNFALRKAFFLFLRDSDDVSVKNLIK